MAQGDISPSSPWRDVVAWALHLVLYSLLLLAYFLLVLRFLAAWFADLFHHHRVEYAACGIFIMIVQAVALDRVSALILRCFKIARH
jgi:hypothetical protein